MSLHWSNFLTLEVSFLSLISLYYAAGCFFFASPSSAAAQLLADHQLEALKSPQFRCLVSMGICIISPIQ